jgi:hypothetical protein
MYQAELELEAELRNLMRVLERSDLESEIAEFEGEGEIAAFRAAKDLWVLAQQGGERNENKLTDAIFYDRHPDWKGRPLRNAPLPLRQEWIEIRDNVVRPYLVNYPAQPPAPPAPAPAPQPPAPAPTTTQEQFGYSQFRNTLQYEPFNYPAAIQAQNDYRKVSGFQPYYNKINSTYPQNARKISITLDPHGVGNLVFSMNGKAFIDFVESDELKHKAAEIMAGGLTTAGTMVGEEEVHLIFKEDVIGMLGLGLTMLDLAQGLEKERMLGGVGPDYDKWRDKQQLQFTFALMAEDWIRMPWGPLQFFNRDPRSLAVELANRYAEFQPIWNTYAPFFWREQELAKYGPNPPPPQTTMGPAPGGF